MLVGGCFGLLKVLSLLWRQVRLRRYRDTGDVDADVDAVYNDDDDDDDEGGGAIMSKSSRYTRIYYFRLHTWLHYMYAVPMFGGGGVLANKIRQSSETTAAMNDCNTSYVLRHGLSVCHAHGLLLLG